MTVAPNQSFRQSILLSLKMFLNIFFNRKPLRKPLRYFIEFEALVQRIFYANLCIRNRR
jgi:hypothetical protein